MVVFRLCATIVTEGMRSDYLQPCKDNGSLAEHVCCSLGPQSSAEPSKTVDILGGVDCIVSPEFNLSTLCLVTWLLVYNAYLLINLCFRMI